MATRLSELKIVDLVGGEPLECLSCSCYMTLKERISDGRGNKGKYRRRRFECIHCGYEELIHADGKFDIEPSRIEKKETKKKLKSEKDESRKIWK